MSDQQLSRLAQIVVSTFQKEEERNHEKKIQVNPVVSKFATWYERLRNAMEYREDELFLRAAIERILKRRLLLGGNAKTAAEPLVRELIWARYLSDDTVPESTVDKVEETIDLYLQLRFQILQHHKMNEGVINEWIYQLMSSSIEHIVHPNKEKEIMANFMFQVLKKQVTIMGESEETRDAQVYIAVRKAFARDDVAFLRYQLFTLYFGTLTSENLSHIAQSFLHGFREITKQLTYEKKDRIYSYVKKRSAIFLIFEDVLKAHEGNILPMLQYEDQFDQAVYHASELRYNTIRAKVRGIIIRSVVFILCTKVLFAFAIEGTYERFRYGHILWTSLIINTATPPLLMVMVSFFIRTPGLDNSKRILNAIKVLLYNDNAQLGDSLTIKPNNEKTTSAFTVIFTILWVFAFIISFGGISFILSKLQFTVVSQAIFMFFLTIVSFLSYRISITANRFTVGDKQGLVTPLVDFLFMPIVRVGRRLTQEISKINLLLFVFDFLIETPFKLLFMFFEQWFHFLRTKNEELE